MQITINGLSAESIEKAANRVRRLQRSYERKNRQFVQELTKIGINVMYENLVGYGDSEIPEPNNPHVMMGHKEGIMRATLRLRGEDVMFVEFGAGVHYNTPAGSSPNPLGVELGYTIGSYGMGQGANDYWYYEEDGVVYQSYGTEATMPMYKADVAIKQQFASIARSVFGS